MTTMAVPNRYSGATEPARADAIVSDLDEAAALSLTLDTSWRSGPTGRSSTGVGA
jgi:hypothetical protein